MTRSAIVVALIAIAIAVGAPASPAGAQNPSPAEKCAERARKKALKAVKRGVSRQRARHRLEVDVVECQSPTLPTATAYFIGTVRADLARFAERFLQGNLAPIAYRNARLDRSRKLRELGSDRRLHKKLRHHDADRDLIPDRRDRCPRTDDGAPTDDKGCPVAGDTRPPVGDEATFRRLLDELRLLHNESCKGAPAPLSPQPFRWGRSSTGPIPGGSFQMHTSQIGGMPEGCEVFYEIKLHFIEPVNASLPPTRDVSIVFREGEDLNPDPDVAVWGLPLDGALSPGRTAAREGFSVYLRVRWRLRSVIGGPSASPWSSVVTQASASLPILRSM